MQKLTFVSDNGSGKSSLPDLTKKDAEERFHLGDRHVMDWRGLFSTSSDQALKLCPLQHQNGTVVIPEEVIDEGISHWQNSIVAQFIGRIPNLSHFQKLANVLWGKDGEVHVKPAGLNLFIIQLLSSDARDRVLEAGPWHIQNKPLIVRKWEPGLQSLEFNMRKLPVWIHLGNVPLEIFTNKGLSYIASILGNPLYMDRFTAKQERLAYARICVEIEASKEIPQTIEIVMGNGSTVTISVKVPWYPQKCSGCCIFGHNEKSCPFKPLEAKGEPTKVWKPKVVQQIDGIDESHKQNKVVTEANAVSIAEVHMKIVEQTEELRTEKKTMPEGRTIANLELPDKNSTLTLRSGSRNRFVTLDTMKDMVLDSGSSKGNEIESKKEAMEPKKMRAASVGVAELMKSLKLKKKGPIDKGKPKQLKTGLPVLGGSRTQVILPFQQGDSHSPPLHLQGRNEAKMNRNSRRLMIGSTAPTCTYNECRGCKYKCRAEQVPVEANDPINSAYHYKCVCHRS